MYLVDSGFCLDSPVFQGVAFRKTLSLIDQHSFDPDLDSLGIATLMEANFLERRIENNRPFKRK